MKFIGFIEKHSNIFVIAAYSVLTLLMAATILIRINTDIPGNVDSFEVLASSYNIDKNISWEKKDNVINSVFYFLNPKNLFSYHTPLFILHKIVGEPLAYNLLWLSSFVLAALGAYFLVKYLTKNKIAAFISGIIYSFFPLHFAYSMGFGGATHIEWIPFFVLFFLKFINKPRFKYFILSGLFFLLIIFNEPHFALYIVLLALLILIYYFLFQRRLLKNKVFIIYFVVAIILVAFFLAWNYQGMIRASFSEDNYLNLGIDHAKWYVADLAGFFTPSYLHPLWGNFFFKNIIESTFTGNNAERTVYIGYIVLLLCAFACIYIKKDNKIKFWLFSSVLFSILAMGPYLHLFGEIKPMIPLPYLILYKYFPFFENIRSTSRIFIIGVLSISVLAGFGIKILLNKYSSNRKHKYILPLVIIAIILIEFWPAIYTSSIETPNFYKELNKEEGNFAILQPLIANNYEFNRIVKYYNAQHNKKVIGSNGSHFVRPKEDDLAFEKNTPIINTLLYDLTNNGKSNIEGNLIKYDYKKIGNFVLNRNNIKYIVFHKKYIGKKGGIKLKDFIYFKNFIEENLEVEKYINDQELLVYKIKGYQENNKPLILSKGENWNELEFDLETTQQTVRMSNDSTLILNNYSNKNKKIELSIDLANNAINSYKKFRKLEVYLNDFLEKTFIIGNNFKNYLIYLDNIKPGKNIIKFKSYDEEGKYIELYENEEKNNLSETIQFRNIKYKEIDEIEIPEIYNKLPNGSYGVVQLPINSNFSFDNEDLGIVKIKDKSIIDYDYYSNYTKNINKDIDIRGEYSYEGLDFYNLMPLMFNSFNFDDVNENFDILNRDYFYSTGHNLIKKNDIRYAIIYKDYLENKEGSYIKNAKSIIHNNIWGSEIYYEDDHYLVFEIKEGEYDPTKIKIKLGGDWEKLLWYLHPAYKKSPCKKQCREINNNSKLQLINDSDNNLDAKLKFTVYADKESLIEKNIINIKTSDENNYSFAINKEEQNILLDLEDIEPGINLVKLHVSQGGEEKKETSIYIADLSVVKK